MGNLNFDTLKYFETLKNSGITEEQSRAQVEALSIALGSSDVATKTDISELKTELKSDISELKTDMLELKVKLIKWIIGMGFSIVGVIFILLRFMLPS